MTIKHPVSDLVVHVAAAHEASMAECAMIEAVHGDAATLDRLHRAALAAAHRKHAAMATLGLDPICPHPLRMAEVWAQEEAAKISIHQLRKAEKKKNNVH